MPDILDQNQKLDPPQDSAAAGGSSVSDDTPISDLLRPGADAPKDEPVLSSIVPPVVKEDSVPVAPVIPVESSPHDAIAPSQSESSSSPTVSSDALPQLHTPPAEPAPTPVVSPPVSTADDSLIVSATVPGVPPSGKKPNTPGHHGFSRGGSLRRGNKRTMLMGLALLFLLLSTGLVAVFVTQQQSLNDIRNRAAEIVDDGGGGTGSLYPTFTPMPTLAPTCDDIGGQCMSVNEAQNYPENCKVGVRSCPGGGIDETCIKCPAGGGGYTYSQATYGGRTAYTYSQATYQGATNTPTRTPTPTGTIAVTQTPTGTPANTGTPTATPTNTTTATPPASCNNSCTVNANCGGGAVCINGACRNPSCTEKTNCTCDIVKAPAACNKTCAVNLDCGSGLVCLDNVCRNPSCTENASCSCGGIAAAPTPQIPVAGTGPSVLGTTAIAGGFLLLLLGLLF